MKGGKKPEYASMLARTSAMLACFSRARLASASVTSSLEESFVALLVGSAGTDESGEQMKAEWVVTREGVAPYAEQHPLGQHGQLGTSGTQQLLPPPSPPLLLMTVAEPVAMAPMASSKRGPFMPGVGGGTLARRRACMAFARCRAVHSLSTDEDPPLSSSC